MPPAIIIAIAASSRKKQEEEDAVQSALLTKQLQDDMTKTFNVKIEDGVFQAMDEKEYIEHKKEKAEEPLGVGDYFHAFIIIGFIAFVIFIIIYSMLQ